MGDSRNTIDQRAQVNDVQFRAALQLIYTLVKVRFRTLTSFLIHLSPNQVPCISIFLSFTQRRFIFHNGVLLMEAITFPYLDYVGCPKMLIYAPLRYLSQVNFPIANFANLKARGSADIGFSQIGDGWH
jgi:hypothetical protein